MLMLIIYTWVAVVGKLVENDEQVERQQKQKR